MPIELGERDAADGTFKDATAQDVTEKPPGYGDRAANENEIPNETDPQP